MAIVHKLSFNGNTNDSVAGSWTSSGTLTSQPNNGLNGNYNFGGGNLYLSETNTGTNLSLLVTISNNSTPDPDGKIFDARGTSGIILFYIRSNTTIGINFGNGASNVEINIGSNTIRRIVGTYNGSVGILYSNGVEIGRNNMTGNTNYTAIRIGQENAGSPNRRYYGNMDELIFDRDVLSPAQVKNDYLFLNGFI